ncbi:unnamed protein product, partial [Toxocara canis]|uniref:FHA domain-containing protein n=1 Tax=Toxocara canis TaxID=6265 RepID=A0A183U371_TOXCA
SARKRRQLPKCVKDLYRKRWKFWKKDELPSKEEQEKWFEGILHMQRMKAATICEDVPSCSQDVKDEDPSEDSDVKEMNEARSEAENCFLSIMQKPKEEDCSMEQGNDDGIVDGAKRLLEEAHKVTSSRDELVKRVERECLRWMEKRSVTREQQLVGALAFQSSFRMLRTNTPVLAVLKAEGTDAFPVQQMSTSLGTDPECDIDLSFMSPICTAVAPHHADLVFNRVCRRFELSPVGVECVCVDGVFYSESDSTELSPSCACSSLPITPMRGTAFLRHGSIINIGCIRLIFASVF